jgi:hypothetical protein
MGNEALRKIVTVSLPVGAMVVCTLLVSAPAILAAPSSLSLGRAHCGTAYRVATVGGHVVHFYCGTAHASVVVGDDVNMHTFTGGACFKQDGLHSVEIGELVVGAETSAPYFGLEFSGQGKDPLVTVAFAGGEWLGAGIKLKLSDGIMRGTFTGKDIISGATLSGSFAC